MATLNSLYYQISILAEILELKNMYKSIFKCKNKIVNLTPNINLKFEHKISGFENEKVMALKDLAKPFNTLLPCCRKTSTLPGNDKYHGMRLLDSLISLGKFFSILCLYLATALE